METKDEDLEFLKSKIESIKIARFTAEMDSIIKLPNNIIYTLKVDAEGNIWFYTSCTGDYALQVEKSFFVTLDYYQKGAGNHLHISGMATVVEADEANYNNRLPYSNLLLLRLKIAHAEYLENEPVPQPNWVKKIRSVFNDILYDTHQRWFDFS